MPRIEELELLRWIAQTCETFGSFTPDPWEASTDMEAQVSTYCCHGCNNEGTARWPGWEITFTHAPDCKAQAFRKLVAEENHAKG